MPLGTLYLLPVPLAQEAEHKSYTLFFQDILLNLHEFIVENEKTARRFIKQTGLNILQQDLVIHDYGKHARDSVDYDVLLQAAIQGRDIGLMSDAGCPGVADPGALVVAAAHKRGIKVVPLVGPSSILLALMASGFSGQKFAFHGYLPIDKRERTAKIKELESQSQREDQTQLFIETPFRNNALWDELLKSCKGETKLCIACNLTAQDEYIRTNSVKEWKGKKVDLHKKPTIFLLYMNTD